MQKVSAKSNGIVPIQIVVSPVSGKRDTRVMFKATVMGSDGNKFNYGRAVFKINGLTFKDTNNDTLYLYPQDGVISLNYAIPYNFQKSSYNISVAYSYGNVSLRNSSTLTVLKTDQYIVLEPVVTMESTGILKGKIYTEWGKLLENARISVKINGITQFSEYTVPDGIIDLKLNTSLHHGLHNVTVISGELNKYNSAVNSTVLTKLEKVDILFATSSLRTTNTTLNIKIVENSTQNAVKTGRLHVYVNGTLYTTRKVTQSETVILLNNLTYSNKTITVKYTDTTNNYVNKTKTRILDIKRSNTQLKSTILSDRESNATLLVDVLDLNNPQKSVSYGKIVIYENNKILATKYISNDTSTVTLDLTREKHTLKLKYYSNNMYNTSTTYKNITIQKNKHNHTFTYQITLPSQTQHNITIYTSTGLDINVINNQLKANYKNTIFNDHTLNGIYVQNLDTMQIDMADSFDQINYHSIAVYASGTTHIQYKGTLNEDINTFNAIYESNMDGYETITLYQNYKQVYSIIIQSKAHNEKIYTTFSTDSNKINKHETITYKPQQWQNSNYDNIQTYTISYKIITPQTLNKTLQTQTQQYNNISQPEITPVHRTNMMGTTYQMLTHTYSQYISQQLNSTTILNKEALCMVGTENNRRNYIHFNDPLQGTNINDDQTDSIIIHNQEVSYSTYKYAQLVLNMLQDNSSTIAGNEIAALITLNNTIILEIDNQTKEITLTSPLNENFTMKYNAKTGILENIIKIDDFEYNGAITNTQSHNHTTTKSLKTGDTSVTIYCPICSEAKITLGYQDKEHNLLGLEIDSDNWLNNFLLFAEG